MLLAINIIRKHATDTLTIFVGDTRVVNYPLISSNYLLLSVPLSVVFVSVDSDHLHHC